MDAFENNAILASYQNLLEFLIGSYGEGEIVLFRVDSSGEGGAVMATRNSDAQVGDEMGPIAKRILAGSTKGYHYLINANLGENGDKNQRKYCYYFIRNSKDRIIGMLLLVLELDYLIKMKQQLDRLLGYEAVNESPQERNDLYHELETEDFSISRYAQSIIRGVIEECGVPVEDMSMEDKAAVVHKLDRMEAFHIKGSVKEAAQQLQISIATIYRLMKR